MSIQISPKHMAIVRKILKPVQVPIYVFGSRAKSKARKLSDLDLVIKDKVEPTLIRQIRFDFEESNLPFKVDLLVWSDLDDAFKKQIERDLLPLFD